MRALLAGPDPILPVWPAGRRPGRALAHHHGPLERRPTRPASAALSPPWANRAVPPRKAACAPPPIPGAAATRSFMDIDVDCAKLPYLLRAYYAWKNGLPFSYVDGVSGKGDLRFSKTANRPVVAHRHRRSWRRHRWRRRAIRAMLDTCLFRDLSHRCRPDAGRAVGFLFAGAPARHHSSRHGDL